MINILDELHNDFLIYAKEVNESRAFPDARDGLKPSQRACLWEMYDKGYNSNKPHVKSAKVIGGVIGNWHPHGDQSAYEALVRMSQPWVNNISEVDWHGANGSLIGGPEAASARYTECRLSKASEDGLFNHINENTVDNQLNFSEDLEWPKVFPAIFPRLFVNGGSGIGYTIANSWPLGNLNEFEEKVKNYLNKEFNCKNIYPDFPTGGIITNKSEIENIYKTGKGSIILRGKVEIDQNLIKITELPYQVYVEQFIQEVKDLSNNDRIEINDIFNKSSKDGMLIEIECDNPNKVLQKLYKLTDLQISYPVNQMALVGGTPKLLNLEDYIKVYYEFNIECLQREFNFKLIKAQNKLEIVDGLLKAIPIMDRVIGVIRSSKSVDEAKRELIKSSFTENQSRAIIDLKLSRLTKLEVSKLKDEQKELNKVIKKCNNILKDKDEQDKEFLNRLSEFVSKYGYNRHTEVVDIKEEKDVTVKQDKVLEEYMIVLTKDQRLKRIKLSEYKKSDEQAVKLCKTEKLVLITTCGMMYKIPCSKIPLCTTKASGTLISDLQKMLGDVLKISKEIVNEQYILFITNQNKILKIESKHLQASKSIGLKLMTLIDNDYVDFIEFINDNTNFLHNTKQVDLKNILLKGRGSKGIKIRYVK